MLNQTDVARVYDTIMSIPGMAETVKLDMRLSRKNVLLLNAVIKRGLSAKGEGDTSLPEGLPKETLQELDAFADECLVKAGLTELNGKLKALSTGK
jgi:hypothetical protein